MLLQGSSDGIAPAAGHGAVPQDIVLSDPHSAARWWWACVDSFASKALPRTSVIVRAARLPMLLLNRLMRVRAAAAIAMLNSAGLTSGPSTAVVPASSSSTAPGATLPGGGEARLRWDFQNMAVTWLSGLEEPERGVSIAVRGPGPVSSVSLTWFSDELCLPFSVPHQVAVAQAPRFQRMGSAASRRSTASLPDMDEHGHQSAGDADKADAASRAQPYTGHTLAPHPAMLARRNGLGPTSLGLRRPPQGMEAGSPGARSGRYPGVRQGAGGDRKAGGASAQLVPFEGIDGSPADSDACFPGGRLAWTASSVRLEDDPLGASLFGDILPPVAPRQRHRDVPANAAATPATPNGAALAARQQSSLQPAAGSEAEAERNIPESGTLTPHPASSVAPATTEAQHQVHSFIGGQPHAAQERGERSAPTPAPAPVIRVNSRDYRDDDDLTATSAVLSSHPDSQLFANYVAFEHAATRLSGPANAALPVLGAMEDQFAVYSATVNGYQCSRDDPAACADWQRAWGLTSTPSSGYFAGLPRSTLATALLPPITRCSQAMGEGSAAPGGWREFRSIAIPEDPSLVQYFGADACQAPVEPANVLALLPSGVVGDVCASLAIAQAS